MTKTVTLTVKTFNKLTAYIGSRPFTEVEGLVQLLRQELSPATAAQAASTDAHTAVSAAGSNGAANASEEERDLSA